MPLRTAISPTRGPIPAALLAFALAACASDPARPVAHRESAIAPPAAAMPPRTLDEAVARAVANAPSVRRAAAEFDRACAEERASLAPPDPAIALTVGIPVDGLGGTRIDASILASLAWLLTRDATIAAANRERETAAQALVLAAAGTAADARRALTNLAAARDGTAAAREALEAETLLAAINGARRTLGEASDAMLEAQSAEVAQARAMLAERLEVERIAAAEVASLCGEAAVAALPEADAPEPVASASLLATLDVLRARADLARAEAGLRAIEGAAGVDPMVGGGFMRDLDERESAQVIVEAKLPIFRQRHERDSARATLDAARAELAEATRRADLDAASARARIESRRDARAARMALVAARAESLHAVETALIAGEASPEDRARAARALADARIALADARIALAEAEAALAARTAISRTDGANP